MKSKASDFTKLELREHVYKRPDSYIGTISHEKEVRWVADLRALEGEEPALSLVEREVSIVKGLVKIFDEVLVNACDHKMKDPSLNEISVIIDAVKGSFSVKNNGEGIPIEMHPTEKVYVPEMIFGHLLTGSSFDDTKERLAGGRNGMGVKLTSIFSTFLEIQTISSGKKYTQRFENNLTKIGKPSIVSSKEKDMTRVTFQPEWKKFGMDGLDSDTLSVLIKRVIDAGAVMQGVKVHLSYISPKGERKLRVFSPSNSFVPFVLLHLRPDVKTYAAKNERWEVVLAMSDGQKFFQSSFVNAIATSRGGTHITYLLDPIVAYIQKQLKKNKVDVPVASVKKHLALFVNCRIVNPSFDSQTKEYMTLHASKFGSEMVFSEAQIAKCLKEGLMDRLVEESRMRDDMKLKRNDGAKCDRLLGIPKLDDANKAGTKEGYKCTLILTEGDSAKALAIAGLTEIGRDYYGVFPLRGKMLNVRDAPPKQIANNEEITHLKKILGLKHGQEYRDTKSMRYGHLMIMADQDVDGSHIKGLVINFFDAYFPSLLQIPGFLLEFITPIVKVTKGKTTRAFYNLPEFQAWRKTASSDYAIKYYKGLGTSSSKEAKEYFSALERHRKCFVEMNDIDRDAIDMAFNKKRAPDRRDWLAQCTSTTFLDSFASDIAIRDFVNKELILFSMADNIRSIPSVVDGLKTSQRKILYGCFKRKLEKEMKVAQLSGYIAETTSYHHGEQSLNMAIINMAQNFVGSNNINLLAPNGQFGTRIQGGKDAASPRYVFTQLEKVARLIFPKEDDDLLNYLEDDGLPVEPEYYCPVIPMLCANGAIGIGTGWSTGIPCHRPLDLLNDIRLRLQAKETRPPIRPFYLGFKGEYEYKDKGVVYHGVLQEVSRDTLHITELPIGVWTNTFKEQLHEMMAGATPSIKNLSEKHSDVSVHFEIKLTEFGVRNYAMQGKNMFKLTNAHSTANMVAFNPEGKLQHYRDINEIIDDFYRVRLDLYAKRKEYMLKVARAKLPLIQNKIRFIDACLSGTIQLRGFDRAGLVQELRSQGYMESNGDFKYLVDLPVWSLSEKELEKQKEKEKELKEVIRLLLLETPESLWTEDLNALEPELKKWEKERASSNKTVSTVVKRATTQKRATTANKKKKT